MALAQKKGHVALAENLLQRLNAVGFLTSWPRTNFRSKVQVQRLKSQIKRSTSSNTTMKHLKSALKKHVWAPRSSHGRIIERHSHSPSIGPCSNMVCSTRTWSEHGPWSFSVHQSPREKPGVLPVRHSRRAPAPRRCSHRPRHLPTPKPGAELVVQHASVLWSVVEVWKMSLVHGFGGKNISIK